MAGGQSPDDLQQHAGLDSNCFSPGCLGTWWGMMLSATGSVRPRLPGKPRWLKGPLVSALQEWLVP